jgi:UDP-N-acetylmuramoyl-tripeptide--D-alanyl-D-alanine ligase
MGASAMGEIDYLSTIAKPDIALVNNAQSAHIEGFGSLEAIALAKAEIYQSLTSDGTAVLNLDQPWVEQWLDIIGQRKCISFSMTEHGADLFAKDIKDTGDGYFSFVLCINTKLAGVCTEQEVRLNHPGVHSISNGLAAAACAFAAGASLTEIVRGLENVALIPGRLQRNVLSDNCVLIDDSYNANPDSFKTAIDVLSMTNSYRILVMGDMGELGAHAEKSHREIGAYAKKAHLNALYAVGTDSAVASEEFEGQHFPDQDSLIDSLKTRIVELESQHESITILVKGSRSSVMENIVQAFVSGGKSSC